MVSYDMSCSTPEWNVRGTDVETDADFVVIGSYVDGALGEYHCDNKASEAIQALA